MHNRGNETVTSDSYLMSYFALTHDLLLTAPLYNQPQIFGLNSGEIKIIEELTTDKNIHILLNAFPKANTVRILLQYLLNVFYQRHASSFLL